jgi:uncharacterized protein YndB with AHSA1/START domain
MSNTNKDEIVISRVFNAPRPLVFNLWIDAEHLKKWYAPDGCLIDFKHLDVSVGGTFHSVITVPNGYQCWCVGTYLEITAPERIVFSMANADDQGNKLGAEDAGKDADWPVETIVTITFEEIAGGKTKLTLHQTASAEVAKRTGAYSGWLQMLDNLDKLLNAEVVNE